MPRFAPSKGVVDCSDRDDSAQAGPSNNRTDVNNTAANATSTAGTHSQGIKSISKSDIHRITSGQVVLDLQSAVKEIVENALDAGSTSIELRFKNFGLDGFEVIDNGTGIKEEDYASVALKHHTSKLEDFDDLTQVTTFGFRGEALSSLCAHAHVSILTATKQQAPMGTLLEFSSDGSLVDSSRKMARQRGCTVNVNDLFHSLPVRRRELEKHSRREYGKVQSLLQAYALISKGVRWNIYNTTKEGRKTAALSVSSAATGDWLYKNYASVFGPKSTVGLRDLDLELEVGDVGAKRRPFTNTRPRKKAKTSDDFDSSNESGSEAEADPNDSSSSTTLTHTLHVHGLISNPTKQSGRTSSDRQFFYINGRPWDNVKISRVCNDVFRSFNHTTSTALPVVIADFALRTDGYDVNVSPDKRTIFLHQEAQLVQAFRAALEEMYAPSRGTFVVNGPTQGNQHTQQSTLSYRPVDGVSTRGDDEEHSDGRGGSAGSDDDVDDDDEIQGLSSEDLEMEKHGTEDVNAHAEADDARAVELDEDATHINMSPPLQDDDDDDEVMLPPRQSRPATTTSFAPSHSNTSHSARQPRMQALQSSLGGLRSSNIAVQGRSSRASIASMLTGFARAGSDVVVSSSRDDDDGDGDGDEEEIADEVDDLPRERGTGNIDGDAEEGEDCVGATRLRSKPVSQAALTSNDSLLDQATRSRSEYNSPAPTSDDATRLRSNHISVIPSSDADVADEEREANLQELDDTGEAEDDHAQQPSASASTQATSSTSSGTVLVDMAALRRRLKRPSHTQPSDDGEDDDDGPLYVDASAVVAAAREDGNTDEEDTTLATTAGLSNTNDAAVSSSLQRVITQEDFATMEILGQFNLGFIIVRRRNTTSDDLFIVDQHASDEKYNFEMLQKQTNIRSQKLIQPRTLELSAIDELIALQHIDTIRSNGFDLEIDQEAIAGSRVKLVSQPVSKDVVFGIKDLEELLYLLRDAGTVTSNAPSTVRCSKARAMFASRACRKSVMIGTALNERQMVSIIRHMGHIKQPWNCPHGRPTMRHLACLKGVEENDKDRDQDIHWDAVLKL